MVNSWVIVYLCDGECQCSTSMGCKLNPYAYYGVCEHTTDADHARNGACACPEEFPGRFERVDKGFRVIYWEREHKEV